MATVTSSNATPHYGQCHTWGRSVYFKTKDATTVIAKSFENGQEKPHVVEQTLESAAVKNLFATRAVKGFLKGVGISDVPPTAELYGPLSDPYANPLMQALCASDLSNNTAETLMRRVQMYASSSDGPALCDALVERFPRAWKLCFEVAQKTSDLQKRLHLLLKGFSYAMEHGDTGALTYLSQATEACRSVSDYKQVIRSYKYLMTRELVLSKHLSHVYFQLAHLIPQDQPQAILKALDRVSHSNPGLTDFSESQQMKIELLKGRCEKVELASRVEALDKKVVSLQDQVNLFAQQMTTIANEATRIAQLLQVSHALNPQTHG